MSAPNLALERPRTIFRLRRRAAPWLLAVALAPSPSSADPGPSLEPAPGGWVAVPLSGGVAGIAAASGVQRPADPATALVDVIRRVSQSHSALDRAVVFQALQDYLDAVDAHLSAVRAVDPQNQGIRLPPDGTVPAALRTVLETMGLTVGADRRVGPVPGDAAAARRHRLALAGVDADAAADRLNAGDAVSVLPPAELVPVPLSPSRWAELLGAPVAPETTVAAILRHPAASFVCHGLLSLDRATLEALAGAPAMLRLLMRVAPGSFATFGRSLQIRDGRVIVPGGRPAEDAWSALVGASPDDVAAFVPLLFQRHGGRVAFLFDTLAQLDGAALAFAMGSTDTDVDPTKRLRRLHEVFVRTVEEWHVEESPFSRPGTPPSQVLVELALGPDGEPRFPPWQRFWELAFADGLPGDVSGSGGSLRAGRVEAPWLLDQISTGPIPFRRSRFRQVLFAQRVFESLRPGEEVDALLTVRAMGSMPALVLLLERLGVRSPGDYAKAVRHASRLTTTLEGEGARTGIALYQAGLSIIERAAWSGSLSHEAALAALAAWLDLPADAEAFRDRFVPWVEDVFLPDLRRATGLDRDSTIDAVLLAAFSGPAADPDSPAREVEWEGLTYRLDLAGGERLRLGRIVGRQGGTDVDEALTYAREVRRLGEGRSASQLRARVAVLQPLAALLERRSLRLLDEQGPGALIVSVTRDAGAAVRALQGTDPDSVRRIVAPLRAIGDALLARELVALVYASALGDASGPALLGGDVSGRHDFAVQDRPPADRLRGAWALPAEVSGARRGWHVRGALPGLDVGLARLVLRRLNDEPPPPPALKGNDRSAFAESVTLLNPRALTDAGRDVAVAAVDRGRQRVRALAGDALALDRLAEEAGFDEWRRRALTWNAGDEARVLALFSLGEFLRLGDPAGEEADVLDAFGVGAFSATGCLCLRMPRRADTFLAGGRPDAGQVPGTVADLTLRVLELLARFELPAALARGVLESATMEYVERVPAAYDGDRLSMVREAQTLGDERMTDHVAALTAVGPLLPVE